jgi:hypothetical protein
MRRRVLRASLVVAAALVVGPVAVVVPGPTWPLFGAGCLLGGVFGALATVRLDDPRAILTLPRILAGFLLPLGWLTVAVGRAESPLGFFATPWFLGALASLAWLVAVVVAADWRTQERIDSLTEHVVFEARDPPENRRQLKLAAGVVLALGVGVAVGAFVFGLAEDAGTIYWLFPAMFPVWVPILAGSDGKEVAVTDGGVRVERQVHDWDTVDGYELTDDALVVSRPRWYHADLSFDRTDVENLSAVTDALEEYVPRR